MDSANKNINWLVCYIYIIITGVLLFVPKTLRGLIGNENNYHILFLASFVFFILKFVVDLIVVIAVFIIDTYKKKYSIDIMGNRIPPKENNNHDLKRAKAYAELELHNDADSETINQAYQRLVLELKSRIDYDEDTKTQEQFDRIEHAYEVLINDITGCAVDVEKAKRYAILGLPYGADIKTIKTAFKHLANDLHPDHNKDANANRKFIVIDKAYKELIEFFK